MNATAIDEIDLDSLEGREALKGTYKTLKDFYLKIDSNDAPSDSDWDYVENKLGPYMNRLREAVIDQKIGEFDGHLSVDGGDSAGADAFYKALSAYDDFLKTVREDREGAAGGNYLPEYINRLGQWIGSVLDGDWLTAVSDAVIDMADEEARESLGYGAGHKRVVDGDKTFDLIKRAFDSTDSVSEIKAGIDSTFSYKTEWMDTIAMGDSEY